jgi:hypothetical protein
MPSEAPDPGAFRFARGASGLYFAVDQQGGLPNWRLGYLPPSSASGLGASLTLQQSWDAGGTYFFLGTLLNSAPVFVGLARRWLSIAPFTESRVAWLANPNDALSAWQIQGLPATDGAGWQVPTRTTISFRNYGVVFGPGCPASAAPSVPAIEISAAESPAAITMTSANGALQLPVVGGAVQIPLAGAGWGCLKFPIAVPVDGEGTGYLDDLDVGLRYFYPDPLIPGSPFSSLKYRVFNLEQGPSEAVVATTLDATIDPMRPLDATRTQFVFAPGSPTLGSFYRTNLGGPIVLTPAATPEPARLLFQLRPRSGQPGTGDPMYLVPDGSFALAPAASVPSEPVPQLLCGTAGPEYIETTADMTLTFVAGKPAYAGAFDPQKDAVPPETDTPRLTTAATTSWAAVSAAAAKPKYFAQPHGAHLFGHQNQSTANGNGTAAYLPGFPVQAGTLPETGALTPAADSYPLAPYAGATDDLAALGRMEVQVLSQQRREVVHEVSVKVAPEPKALAAAAVGEATCKAGTPQGLIAEFASAPGGECDGTTWKQLNLALSSDGTRLTLDSIVDPLRSALLTPQQFLVASDPTAMKTYVGADKQIHIGDWKFFLETDDWSRHGTIMLIKNTPKSLRELVADTTTWVLADKFNAAVAATQQQLQSIIDNIPADPDFDYFRNTIVVDPNWNGILFLNVYVPLGDLPPQLEGLAAGIDPALFKAHHLGVNQSPLSPTLDQKDSSLFGLIYYVKDRPLSATTYDFNVLTLKVLFANSGIAAFSSIIQVVLNTLFATAVKQVQVPNNMIELDGVYQKHGDTHAYVFSESRPTTFDTVDDKVLAAVAIRKATFATLVGADGDSSQIETRFSFWGSLAFKELMVEGDDGGDAMPYDIFSYDALSYSGLLLHMNFARAQPGTRSFAFDPAEMEFDPTTSVAREHALARHFPLTIKRMLTATEGGKTAADLGYMTLGTQLDNTTPGSPWYGLDFDLNLGTAGALAAKAGLVVSLALVWAPSSYGLPVFAGLKLPASSGSKNEISIEGIIKITMYSRLLLYSDGAYLLKLNGIAMSLFGKTLPPGGTFDFFLFGDSDPTAGSNSLGWYGAYKKDKPANGDQNGGPSLTGSNRRALTTGGDP